MNFFQIFKKTFKGDARIFYVFFYFSHFYLIKFQKFAARKFDDIKKSTFLAYNTYACTYPEKISFCLKMRPYGCYMAYFGEYGFFIFDQPQKLKKFKDSQNDPK